MNSGKHFMTSSFEQMTWLSSILYDKIRNFAYAIKYKNYLLSFNEKDISPTSCRTNATIKLINETV